MSDFLSEMLQDNGIISRSVKINGKEGPVFFKKINAGQKAELLKGLKTQVVPGKESTFEIDLSDNAESKCKLVQYSVCNDDGTRRFKKLDEVRAIDAHIVDALYRAADEVNRDKSLDDEPGKS